MFGAVAFSRAGLCAALPAVFLSAIVLVGRAATEPVRAADAGLPDAATILDRHVEATGGAEAHRKLTSRITDSTISNERAGMSMTMSTTQAAPRMTSSTINIPGMGTSRDGCDGEIAWEINPMQGPRVKSGEELAMALRSATFHADVDWRDLLTVTTVGRESLEVGEAWVVEAKPQVGPTETRYYDMESGLLRRVDVSVATPMGEIPAKTYVREYTEVDGILVASKIFQDMGMMQVDIDITSIRHNVELEEDTFALPEEIQTLLERSRGTATDGS